MGLVYALDPFTKLIRVHFPRGRFAFISINLGGQQDTSVAYTTAFPRVQMIGRPPIGAGQGGAKVMSDPVGFQTSTGVPHVPGPFKVIRKKPWYSMWTDDVVPVGGFYDGNWTFIYNISKFKADFPKVKSVVFVITNLFHTENGPPGGFYTGTFNASFNSTIFTKDAAWEIGADNGLSVSGSRGASDAVFASDPGIVGGIHVPLDTPTRYQNTLLYDLNKRARWRRG